MAQLLELLSGCTTKEIKVNEPMSHHTTFHIGGPCDFLATPSNEAELVALIKVAKENNLPITFIGNGSNLLVRDKGIRGLVIKIAGAMADEKINGNELTFSAGISLALAARKAAKLSLSGMEFASGIPGTLGGAAYMNAGAYDGEMQNIIKSVRVLKANGNFVELSNKEMGFSYRKSIIQGSGDIITSVTLALNPGDENAINEKMDDFSTRRNAKQPLDKPSAGSTFKRPPGNFAGTLIDKTGLKGYTVGGAQVSEKHAGFVVNIGNATCKDVLTLIKDVQAKVFAAHGVKLETEVLLLGEE